MRLSKIKLAGFKSFVDPTTIRLPSNLVSILGPNGCGKSNTIDAVRWVMGESSAKNLRGDSMTDVIFNGAASRKPVGQAMVELVFDNSDGTISGQYASFNEISVKRTVNRDAQSIYYLNNTRCRRRDITDLFSGTGLGPRSYSIIEQGMISRLIESKPEELRVYIEEAAGISKYKDRRRETENRIRHTRENLERLEDIRNELGTQLARLQRQARTAERFKELKQTERLVKAQLSALRWRNIDQQAFEQQQLITERETTQEQLNAELRNIELGLENSREEHINANEHFNQVQGEFYRVGAEIARLEQSIEHIRERQKQHKEDYTEAVNAYEQAQQHMSIDSDKMQQILEQIAELEPEFEQSQEIAEMSAEQLLDFENQMHDLQQQWDDFNLTAQQPIQNAQIERAKISQLEQHQKQTQQRLEKLNDELSQFSNDDLAIEIEQLQEELLIAEQQTEESELQLEQQKELSHGLQEQYIQHNEQLTESRNKMQTLIGRLASLEALQQAALGQEEGQASANSSSQITTWLRKNNLQDNKRLAQQIIVQNGWEKAIECVLGDVLEAICLEDFAPVYDEVVATNQNQALNLFENNVSSLVNQNPNPIDLPCLSHFIQNYQPIDSILASIHAADNLEQALQWRAKLPSGYSIITKDGIWLGSNWIRIIDDSGEKSGVLERETVIKELNENIESTETLIDEQKLQTEQIRSKQLQEESNRDQLQAELTLHHRTQADLKTKINTKTLRIEQIKSRKDRLLSDIDEISSQTESDSEQIIIANEKLHIALEQADMAAEEKESLQMQRDSHREQLNDIRDTARQARDKSHSIEIRLKGLRSELSSTEQALSRIEIQLSGLKNRCEQLNDLLANEDNPEENLRIELEEYLGLKLETDEQLSLARNNVDELEQRLRQFDSLRSQAEQKLQDLRAQLEQIRLHLQELKLKRQTQQENIDESGFSMAELFLQIPEDALEEEWVEEVKQLARKIQSLGSINLAAIDEYQEQLTRKEYLDSQNNDLMEAMATLEGAIAKIDRETRTRFKATYDEINSGLQQLFPRLFGGGHAYLDLTGDDLLDTGVTIMARPPGKRNSTIHLLSGGEKAMTAVALVFSIFALNPAPFCMLDEVDAPLDEANVGRFCSMVKEMSEQVQFIYITHNKTTMEMSNHLSGVTMKEPGVSRIVDVDINEAVDMVEA